MYKQSTYLVGTYFPSYLPMCETYFLQNWVTKVKPNINSVEVHPQLGVITGIQWMVAGGCWFTVAPVQYHGKLFVWRVPMFTPCKSLWGKRLEWVQTVLASTLQAPYFGKTWLLGLYQENLSPNSWGVGIRTLPFIRLVNYASLVHDKFCLVR
jgi:hypothetical protein